MDAKRHVRRRYYWRHHQPEKELRSTKVLRYKVRVFSDVLMLPGVEEYLMQRYRDDEEKQLIEAAYRMVARIKAIKEEKERLN